MQYNVHCWRQPNARTDQTLRAILGRRGRDEFPHAMPFADVILRGQHPNIDQRPNNADRAQDNMPHAARRGELQAF